jgi:membrane-bound ClpP family serine protease
MAAAAPVFLDQTTLLPGWVRPWGSCFLLLAWSLCAAPAEEPSFKEGLFISVRNPITSEGVNRIKTEVERVLFREDRPARIFVFDFNPGRGSFSYPASTKDYGPCADLTEFLLELPNKAAGLSTIAFVHQEVTGHTVLPVLACNEIVMSHEGKLGAVMRDQPGRLRKDKAEFYQEVARARGLSDVLVLKMLDPDVEVIAGSRLGGIVYLDARRLKEAPAKGIVVNERDPVPGLEAGRMGLCSAEDARTKLGLCKLIKENRREVAEAYQLAPSSLREDPLEGRDPIAERITIREPINSALDETLRRQIRQALARNVNFIIFQLECRGGDTLIARDLAERIRELKDDKGELPVMTVAYIPNSAPDAATFLALGCTEIVMGEQAEIGDFESLVYERHGFGHAKVEANSDRYKTIRESLVGLAEEQGYSPLLARGMLDRQVSIYRVQSQKGQSRWRLLTEEEFQADQAGPAEWGNKQLIKPGGANGKFLRLRGEQARNLGLARDLAVDFNDLCRLYGLQREKVRDAGFDFLYELGCFLRHPVVGVFLVMVGIACLILELKLPGVSLPGVISAVCFVLYFWAHSQLAGQITMLAILLFVLGLVLLGLEIFVLPGFGVTGISGIALVILSLALATLEKKPETTQEWVNFGGSLGAVGLSLVGAITLAALAGWYLPSIPYVNRLILKPPSEASDELDEEGLPARADALAPDRSALLGAVGVAATALRPAGIARIGDEFVDVVTEGGYVHTGTRVQVIEIEGARVVVKEV